MEGAGALWFCQSQRTSLCEPLVGAARVHVSQAAFAGACQLHECAGASL